MRAAKGWALGILTSTRGGRHLNGAPTTEFMRFPEDLGEELFGVSTAGDQRAYKGKARLVVWHEQYKALVDMLGMCYYTSIWSRPDLLTPEDYAKLFSAATGMDFSSKELMLAGKRVHNVEKGINTLHAGFTRQDDLPPRILMEESIKTGDMIGERLEKEKWEQMLDEYYDLQGWDRETGWQKKETLDGLELNEIAKELEKSGKLR
jgi:aldehyde:ferredoxin oxidoreductase